MHYVFCFAAFEILAEKIPKSSGTSKFGSIYLEVLPEDLVSKK